MTDWNMYTDDCLGVGVQQLDPLGRATTFAYDAAGRQTSILDARGVEATFQYDAAGHLTRRMSTHDPPVTFAYDPVGNRTEAVDATGRSTFTYDLLNRRTGVVDPAGHGITYTYDAIGQRAAMTAPHGGIFTYAYGPRGQIDYLVNPQGDRTTFSYDAAGRRTLTELANGTRASYTYDAASRVQQLYNLKADGSVILGLTYKHDPVGNPSSMLESSGDRVTWTYDATNQLTREQRSGDWAYDHTYAYDALGNRLLKDASGALTTSTYDLANQLVTSQDANGVTTYTYDLAGNLHVVQQPTGARTTTTWDDQKRQIGVLLPDGSAVTNTFRFDGLRHSQEDSAGTTKFIWDVNNYLAETDAADEIQAVYTNEPQPYGNLISQYRKGPTLWLPSYYHYDALGSTRALTDDAGDVTDTYLYDAWGNAIASIGSTDNPFRWVGQVGYYWDKGLGTFYIRARVYDPVTGRWMSEDSLRDEAAHANLLRYGRNTPTYMVDPTGLFDWTVLIGPPSMRQGLLYRSGGISVGWAFFSRSSLPRIAGAWAIVRGDFYADLWRALSTTVPRYREAKFTMLIPYLCRCDPRTRGALLEEEFDPYSPLMDIENPTIPTFGVGSLWGFAGMSGSYKIELARPKTQSGSSRNDMCQHWEVTLEARWIKEATWFFGVAARGFSYRHGAWTGDQTSVVAKQTAMYRVNCCIEADGPKISGYQFWRT